MEHQLKQAFERIDDILWEDWDPIGANEFGAARDEYHTYAWQVVDFKCKGIDSETIAQYLHLIETKHMGLGGNLEACRRVSEKITRLVL
jgi:hypothetical protein